MTGIPVINMLRGGLSEVIIHDSILVNTKTIKIIGNCLDKHRRSTEIVLTIFWCLVLLQILITNTVNSKTSVILHASLISLRVLTVEREVEMEVRIFLLKLPEVFKEECLTE